MSMATIKLYTFFHLNLAYSSIEEEDRSAVVEYCYWPLLHLVKELSVPVGIEASAYTLEQAAAIDPGWLEELRRLTSQGLCEFIGSGYAQLIGPLVPAEVNKANLEIGNEVYKELLGFRPALALINEQAYSSGLIQHYLNAGYKAIIMEWDNPVLYQNNWASDWFYLPQYACDQHGKEIALIWNNSIAFQQFQRFAHGDLALDDYVSLLVAHTGGRQRAYPLYGNDAEIFDFRPGRYLTEASIQIEGEWKRICLLFKVLSEDSRFRFIAPGEVLSLSNEDGAGNRLQLETPQQPVPVKKQGKYNLTRWAVTGRDDIGINTTCWQIYETLKNQTAAEKEDWRELCYLWSSDFRTHITDKRWAAYLKRLNSFEKRIGRGKVSKQLTTGKGKDSQHVGRNADAKVDRSGHILSVETDLTLLKLNCRRGLAIDSLWLDNKSDLAQAGTLPHGYYSNIKYGVDWYSGHLVFELLGQPKITDLEAVEPIIEMLNAETLSVKATINCPMGKIGKQYLIDLEEAKISLCYNLDWDIIPPGSLRLGFITLNPGLFDRETLFYETENGGLLPERFFLQGRKVDHGSAVSFMVSASSGLGLTGGWVDLGDCKRRLRVEVDKSKAALIGLISYAEFHGTYFYRLALSAGEMDETRFNNKLNTKAVYCIRLKNA